MILKFDYVPQKDTRYDYADNMHIEIDTTNKTYFSYEDNKKGDGIPLRRKIDIVNLIAKAEADGYTMKGRN